MQQKKLAVAIAAAYGFVFTYAPEAQARRPRWPLPPFPIRRPMPLRPVLQPMARLRPGQMSRDVIASDRVHAPPQRNVAKRADHMSVLDSKALEDNRVYRVQDLQQLLPSTTVNYVHARQMSFAVRGLGNNPASDGLEGSVGLYLDNVYLARPGMAAFDALDIQQLELLRGPQGTLFGKNTTAGVLNITSKQPTFRSENSARYRRPGGLCAGQGRAVGRFLGYRCGPPVGLQDP
jgi:iron complex outermembrane receptor protein